MKHFTLHLSNKQTVLIDEKDLEKFEKNIGSGNLIRLKGGIINPSFVVAVIPTDTGVSRKVDGYVDEKTGKYVILEDDETPLELRDSFENNPKIFL